MPMHDATDDEHLQRLRQAVRLAGRQSETACIGTLLGALAPPEPATTAFAAELLEPLRAAPGGGSPVAELMHAFPLASPEGRALMSLAEAALRIAEPSTVDALIHEKMAGGHWLGHADRHHSLLVNSTAGAAALLAALCELAGQPTPTGQAMATLLHAGDPLIRRSVGLALRQLAGHFVLGQDIDEALAASGADHAATGIGQPYARRYLYSYDMLGEAALTASDAARYHAAYAEAIVAVGRAAGHSGPCAGPGISLKLSALHPRYAQAQRERIFAEMLPRLHELMRLARQYDIAVNIDAEEADRLELSLDLFTALAADPGLAGWDGLGFVVQAYQKRAGAVIDYLLALARRHRRRLPLRLVKGAYWDSEIKRAQHDGLAGYPVFTRKCHTDLAYRVAARKLLAAGDACYPQFATHNALTVADVALTAARGGVRDYEFQCLHGMGEPLYDLALARHPDWRCRIYAPVGRHDALLPYLVRRLLENGANSAFVNRLADPHTPLARLLRDPLDDTLAGGRQMHPAIPLPEALFGERRRNAGGLDLSDPEVIATLEDYPPALPDAPSEATPEIARQALDRAALALPAWHARPPQARAALLRAVADRLEDARLDLAALCVHEGGKTWPNALGEVREAVDFCRYYAAQAEWLPTGPGGDPGVAVCISPWNFPLAIFVGQVAAALVAGCSVLAKPARQTPRVADAAVRLFHAAGVPAAALTCLPGPGALLGTALLPDPRVRTVLFTGSVAVAHELRRQLARQPAHPNGPARLIAETGGQNAMIVDPSALPEQVIQDVLTSAFDSAGQRCSALRVLCLPAAGADALLSRLKAAMAELTLGDPARLATDVGPVIDAAALQPLETHVAAMRDAGCPVFQACRDQRPAHGRHAAFLSPTLIEITDLAQLPGEVFGPIVHVLRYPAAALDPLVDALNATGYGLTLGLHTRLEQRIEQVAARARVGNLYVNRSMIGAVVGVQPFGGMGLSGTGPKAGGPLYLHGIVGGAPDPANWPGFHGRPLKAAENDMAPLACLESWAARHAQTELAMRCQHYRTTSLYGCRLDLPGPTGETNTLHFRPRGRVLCLASALPDLLHQLAAVFATGNQAVLPPAETAQAYLSALPAALHAALVDTPSPRPGRTAEAPLANLTTDDWHTIDAVLHAGPLDALADTLARLTTEPGPLRALIPPEAPAGDYPLWRLLAEQTVSINTAASGGNAALVAGID